MHAHQAREAAVGKDPNYPIKVAVVQAEPCWFDVDAAVAKTCTLITEAGKNGAQLIAFPELWIPGYPYFIYAHAYKECIPYMRRYFRNGVEVDSSHMELIRKAARAANIMVVLGYAERDHGSLYMAQTFIGPDGAVLLHRRKFKPTSYERTIFGDASGDCSTNVVQTPIGRVGGLQCFEHLQPLLKYNTYSQGEQIHVAAWPALFPPVGSGPSMPFFNTVESCKWLTHTLAVEGATFVLLASSTQSEVGLRANGLLPEDTRGKEKPHCAVVGGGFTEIIAPDGRTLHAVLDPCWEGLLYGELDFNEIYLAKNVVDVVGQYSRPDVFSLRVDGEVKRQCVYEAHGQFSHKERFPALTADELKNEHKLTGMGKSKEENGVHE